MSNEPKAPVGLDPETLAAYIDKRLPPEQRAVVEAELANDPDAYVVLVETMKALDAAVIPSQKAISRRWVVAGTLLAAAAAFALAVRMHSSSDGTNPRFEGLVAATRSNRQIQPRLSGGFEYSPLKETLRGPGSSQENLALIAAAGELQKRAETDRSPETVHAWGVAQLLLGRYDDAVATLLSAAERDPKSAATLSDLGAAYLARSQTTRSTADLEAASQRIDQALTIEPDRLEALFNRVEVMRSRGLIIEARQAAQKYFEKDSSSPWAQELRNSERR
jgi:tetratricopeptide (TPR) repeat protein